jgi:hypothetical protein
MEGRMQAKNRMRNEIKREQRKKEMTGQSRKGKRRKKHKM